MARLIDLKKKKKEEVKEEPLPVPEKKEDIGLTEKIRYRTGPETITWIGPRYYHAPDMRFVVGAAIILFGLSLFFEIFHRNFITAILLGLLGVLILIHSQRKPDTISFEITPVGIRIDTKMYGFREFRSFWVDYEPEYGIRELSFQFHKWYLPYLKVPLEDQDPVQIRENLVLFLPETEHHTNLAEVLAKKLGL